MWTQLSGIYRMAKLLNLKNLYDKKFDIFDFDGDYEKVFGNPEKKGFWLVYGAEKHGKTWFSLKVAEYISQFEKVLYVSAEEGIDKTFVDACARAKLQPSNSLQFAEYIPLEELETKLEKRRSARVVFFDNVTIYSDELKGGKVRNMMRQHSNKLFVFIAHEEDNKPYTAQAKLIKKLSKIIIRVEGLAAFVSGRCPGGTLMIDEEKASIYHGTQIIEN